MPVAVSDQQQICSPGCLLTSAAARAQREQVHDDHAQAACHMVRGTQRGRMSLLHNWSRAAQDRVSWRDRIQHLLGQTQHKAANVYLIVCSLGSAAYCMVLCCAEGSSCRALQVLDAGCCHLAAPLWHKASFSICTQGPSVSCRVWRTWQALTWSIRVRLLQGCNKPLCSQSRALSTCLGEEPQHAHGYVDMGKSDGP